MASKSRDHDSDERLSSNASVGARGDRLSTERDFTEDHDDTLRADERRALLRDTNVVLPVPPAIEGYHLCWLTTTNQKDPIERRYRLGYELVQPEELPGFKFDTLKSGEATSDRIQINEMVLAKIPMELWLQDMKDVHYDQPREQMDNLNKSVSAMNDGRGRPIGYTGNEFNNGKTEGFQTMKGMSGRFGSFRGVA